MKKMGVVWHVGKDVWRRRQDNGSGSGSCVVMVKACKGKVVAGTKA